MPSCLRSGLVLGMVVGLVACGTDRRTDQGPNPIRITLDTKDVDAGAGSGQTAQPRKIVHVDPIYPPAARVDRVQGVVVVMLTVAADGSVSDVLVTRGDPRLNQAAVDAVRQWRYEPTQTRAPLRVTATLNFALPPSGGLQSLAQSGNRPIPPLTPTHDLTGDWRGDDGRIYHVRTVGAEIFWFSVATQELAPNVFHGDLRKPNEYTGRWAEIAPGNHRAIGVLTVRVVHRYLLEALTQTPGVVGRRWEWVPRPGADRGNSSTVDQGARRP